MDKKFKILAAVIISVLFFQNSQILAVTGDTKINLEVTGASVCNNNGICEAGENESNCPADCGCNNNGTCESARGENSSNCPADCLVAPEEGGAIFIPDTTPPSIYNLSISEITLNSASISWETFENSLCQVFIGKDEEYKLEVIIETALYKLHSARIIGLFPSTDYHFKISCRDAAMNESETGDQRFTTLTPPDTTPPANISAFQAASGDSKIILSWRNPKDPDFKGVKIIRSTDFYPQDPDSGIPVYDGTGEYFIDADLINGTKYYYTAFAYDKAGNYSSGAVVSKIPRLPEEEPEIVLPPIEQPTTTAPAEVEIISLDDFDFLQDLKNISFSESGEIEMKADRPLTLKIDYEKVPEVLKTIMVTLEQPATGEGEKNKFFSFILRVNKEKTAYLATLVPPDPGTYPLTISILDYKNQAMKQIQGQLVVPKSEESAAPVSWKDRFAGKIYLCLLLILITLLMIILFIKKKKRRLETEN